jgi:hypothetical protein
MKSKILSVGVIPLLFTGCASIVDGGKKTVHFNSHPEGATVTVYDKQDNEVAVITTPGQMALERGGFYSRDRYRVDYTLTGYYPYEARIDSRLDGWYWGNIVWCVFGLTGGVIAFGLVDPMTGSMWTLDPRDVNCNFVSTSLNLTTNEVLEAQIKANAPTNSVPPPKEQKKTNK